MRLAAFRTGRLRMALAAGLLTAFGVCLRLLRAFLVFFDLRAAFLFLLFVLRFPFFLRFLRLRCRRRRLLALLALLFLARLALRLRRFGDEAFLFPPARRTKVLGDFFAMLPSRQARPIARMTSVREVGDTFFVRTK